MRNITLHSP